MASKRRDIIDYAEDSCTDERDDEDETVLRRARKASATTNSSTETLVTGNIPDFPEKNVTAAAMRRRGRAPSKRPCLNRNALMARENRQRKKEYIERIESRLQVSQKENFELAAKIKQQSIEIKRLSAELSYLKTVLNNKSQIASLLQAMNQSLERMHGSESVESSAANNFDKPSVDVLNWVTRDQTNSSKTNRIPMSGSTNICSKVYGDVSQSSFFGQLNDTIIVARKTMPVKNCRISKSENQSSVESMEEEKFLQKSSPQSGSFCEYLMDRRSTGIDNQFPSTPMSVISNSLMNDASLSDTDFSQLSPFNVDFFDNFQSEVANPLQFEQDALELFNDNTLFHTLDKDQSILNSRVVDPLEINTMSDALNEKTLFNSLETTGVCLHINSNKVSLEYCSICHLNSLNNHNSEFL